MTSSHVNRFSDINAGRDVKLDLLQIFLNTDKNGGIEITEGVLERLSTAIVDASTKRALNLTDTFSSDPMGSDNAVLSGVFYNQDQKNKAIEAAAQAVWDVATGDEVLLFETEPHRAALLNFFSNTPDFFIEAKRVGRPLTISELPRALGLWADKTLSSIEQKDLFYLRAVALFLNCQYGRALELIEPLARTEENSSYSILTAECALNVGHYSVALSHLNQALNYRFELETDFELRIALLKSNIGACHEAMLESEDAIREYRQALELLPVETGQLLPALIRALILNNLGFSLMTIGDESVFDGNLEEAEKCFRDSLTLREGADDTYANQAIVLFNLAEVQRKLGDSASASFFLDRAQGTLDRLNKRHILHASIENMRGKAHFDLGEYEQALICFRAARATLAMHFGEKSEKSILTSYSIAQTLEAMGSPEARQHLLHAKSLAIEAFDDPHHPLTRMIESDLSGSFVKRLFRLQ